MKNKRKPIDWGTFIITKCDKMYKLKVSTSKKKIKGGWHRNMINKISNNWTKRSHTAGYNGWGTRKVTAYPTKKNTQKHCDCHKI